MVEEEDEEEAPAMVANEGPLVAEEGGRIAARTDGWAKRPDEWINGLIIWMYNNKYLCVSAIEK